MDFERGDTVRIIGLQLTDCIVVKVDCETICTVIVLDNHPYTSRIPSIDMRRVKSPPRLKELKDKLKKTFEMNTM